MPGATADLAVFTEYHEGGVDGEDEGAGGGAGDSGGVAEDCGRGYHLLHRFYGWQRYNLQQGRVWCRSWTLD